MSKAPGERRVSIRKTEWLAVPSTRPRLTPRRRVVSETSHDGLRVLHVECGHACTTRQHTVIEETPCLLCAEEMQPKTPGS